EALTAEFYNYYTKPILIVDDKTIYEDIYNNYIGKSLKENSDLTINYWVDPLPSMPGSTIYSYKWAYAGGKRWNMYADKYIDTLYWVFYDEIEKDEPDFSSEDYVFSGENLRKYFNNYSDQHGRNKAILDLFISEKEYKEEKLNLSGFDYGYNKHTYSIAEKRGVEDDVFGFGLQFDDATPFQAFFGISSSETKEVLPLVKIETADLYLSDEKFSEKYYVEEKEVSEIKAYVTLQSLFNKETWILRYDACEYYGCAEAECSEGGFDFFAQESVYLDFDILSFRFAQGNSKYTVANIMSPTDQFNDITGIKQPLNWWEKLIQWLKNLLSLIGAWGALIVFVALGLIGLWLFFKLIRFVCDVAQNPIVRLVLCLIIIAGTIVLYYFYVNWVIGIIVGLGGLW
ncbi:MAG: hypothetical protein IJX16_06625, partial [Clostridia bacterium]|nr:hypothetical protein [Clostridia bacterium]